MDILPIGIKDQCAAVCQLSTEADAVQKGKLQQALFADLAQIAGNDKIEVIWPNAKIRKVGADGGPGRRCHGSSHIICILDAQIRDSTDCTAVDPWADPGGTDQRRAGACDSPLGGGSPLPAVAQRKAVLPF